MPAAVINLRAILDAVATLLKRGAYSVHLYTNNYTPTAFALLTDFTEAAYPGYPVGGITPTLPGYGSLGNQAAMTPVQVFFPAPTSGPTVFVYGFWITFVPNAYPPAVPVVLLASNFDGTPVKMQVGGPELPVSVGFRALDEAHP